MYDKFSKFLINKGNQIEVKEKECPAILLLQNPDDKEIYYSIAIVNYDHVEIINILKTSKVRDLIEGFDASQDLNLEDISDMLDDENNNSVE